MRTVLIGSDFMYDKDGNLKPIEINTNIGWHSQKIETDTDSLDLTELSNFIVSNGFTKVVYIGSLSKFSDKLPQMATSLNVVYETISVNNKSITIPYVEDNDTTLIIRSAYDTTALVDDTYCKDKINFLNLIKNETFGSEFAYMDNSGILVNNITTIPNNGNHPNFILKAKYPEYDRNVYPKLYKVSTQEELNVILQNIDVNYFLMEFHINNDLLFENHIVLYRGLTISFPPNLETIALGGYRTMPPLNLEEDSTFDTVTFELNQDYRNRYITNDSQISQPKLLDTDKVQLADGTFKTALELEVGDVLKTIDIPNPNNVNLEEETADFNITWETFSTGVTYSSNVLTGKKRVSTLVSYVRLDFTDGTSWEDTANSNYLINRDNTIRFVSLQYDETEPYDYSLKLNDKVILIDTTDSNINFVEKTVSAITKTNIVFTGWVLTVENAHLFLTQTSDNTSFVSIEHNAACFDDVVFCSRTQCSKTQYCTRAGNPCEGRTSCACSLGCVPKNKI